MTERSEVFRATVSASGEGVFLHDPMLEGEGTTVWWHELGKDDVRYGDFELENFRPVKIVEANQIILDLVGGMTLKHLADIIRNAPNLEQDEAIDQVLNELADQIIDQVNLDLYLGDVPWKDLD